MSLISDSIFLSAHSLLLTPYTLPLNAYFLPLAAYSSLLTAYTLPLLALGAFGVGFSKSGFSGVGMIHVLIFAYVFGVRDSTGVLLPLLIVGDVLSVRQFGKEVDWRYFRRLLLPSLIGVVIGWSLMSFLRESAFKTIVGSIILALAGLQAMRIWRPTVYEHVPHSRWFALGLGLLAGVTTMLANAAGPIVALYLLAVSLPKFQLIGTSAWFFLTLNVFKIPFSASLGLIDGQTLLINALLAPFVYLGLRAGRALVHRIKQRTFDTLLLIITALAALRLVLFA